MTNKKAIGLVLGAMCFALTAGICIQIKTVNNTSSKVSQNYEENNLRAEVLKYKEKYDNLLKETEKIDAQLQEQIDGATKNNSELEDAKNQINEGNKMIGLTEVTGPGIILTIAYITVLFDSMNNSLFNPVLPYLVKELNATTFQEGIFFSVYSAMQLISK